MGVCGRSPRHLDDMWPWGILGFCHHGSMSISRCLSWTCSCASHGVKWHLRFYYQVCSSWDQSIFSVARCESPEVLSCSFILYHALKHHLPSYIRHRQRIKDAALHPQSAQQPETRKAVCRKQLLLSACTQTRVLVFLRSTEAADPVRVDTTSLWFIVDFFHNSGIVCQACFLFHYVANKQSKNSSEGLRRRGT